ncbi:MAG: amidohydrolase family protein [bacterium]|nr:amidohydrolase family protein [bacterium]
MSSFSYILENGAVIDGSGFPMTKSDVGISGDVIKSVGSTRLGNAVRKIDIAGKIIIPGIIDITNHSDTHWTLFSQPEQQSLVSQGITTVLGGVCGSSLAPLVDQTAIRAIQKWTDISEININWRTQEEFFTELGKHNFGVNYGTLVGHGTLRRGIAGDAMRPLEKSELESMKLLLKRSLDEGALGLSFNLSSSHGGHAPQDEIIHLARVVGEAKKLIVIHLRNEGKRLLSSVVEAINIARSSGAAVQISHFKAIGRRAWHDFDKAITMIKRARNQEKLDISFDVFPYLRTGSLLYTFLPEWMLEGGKESILDLLKSQEKRKVVTESIKDLTLHYDNIVIASAHKDRSSVGKSIAAIADDSGLSTEEVLINILSVNGLGVTIFNKTLLSKHVMAAAKEPYSLFGSDGVGGNPDVRKGNLTHPRSYGSTARYISRLVKKNNILSWEEAVKKMTSMPAERIGFAGSRGLVKEGYAADLVVIDPAELEDLATYSDPFVFSKGIDYVFVNGELEYEKGTATGVLAGKILRQG